MSDNKMDQWLKTEERENETIVTQEVKVQQVQVKWHRTFSWNAKTVKIVINTYLVDLYVEVVKMNRNHNVSLFWNIVQWKYEASQTSSAFWNKT